MIEDIATEVLRALSIACGVRVQTLSAVPSDTRRLIRSELDAGNLDEAELTLDGARYLAYRVHNQRDAVIVAGPFRMPDDPPTATHVPDLDNMGRQRLEAALQAVGPGLRAAIIDRRSRLELASRLEVVSSSVLAVTGELSLDTVLRRIVDLARELAGARYAALGVPDANGVLIEFVTSGMTPEQEARIGQRPHGRGILGLLLAEQHSIRLENLHDHPASVGFPPEHPPMTSFLGVPIVARGQVLGNLYLTEKRVGKVFTEADERLIELIARHAAVAIENARLYSELEQQQTRLRAVVDQFPEGILIAEASPLMITLANREVSEIVGWDIPTPITLDEWFRRNQRFFPGGDALPLDQLPLYRALTAGEEVVHDEVRILRSNGSLVTILVNATPLRGPSGAITGAVAAFQDITQIKDAEHLKDDFLSLVSHELRTPLTSIQGGGTLLDREWERLDEETRRELVGDIARESRRLGDLIENMVQLSNIRAGRLALLTEPVQLRIVIERAVAAVRQTAGAHTFVTHVPPDLMADADERTLDQVLRNLLHNAVKYTPQGTEIVISAERDDAMCIVSVRDHGPGIEQEEIPFLFDRFRRSARAREGKAPGMGLGLYLSKHLVEAHGGRIWVEPAPGGGARFAFTVPWLDPEE